MIKARARTTIAARTTRPSRTTTRPGKAATPVKAAPRAPVSRARSAAGCEVRIGVLAGWDESGPLVDFEGNTRGPVRARVTTAVAAPPPGAAFEPGREVVLLVDPRPDKLPVLVGLLQPLDSSAARGQVEARIDGRRVELEGRDEVVLRCGEASITLRSNGRVSIRGVQVETRARGLNRIKGGSVAIN